ncbi:hypothetical protein B0H12DRAFT_594335 [Mycena haematopus]|nr:hypothetical protein B0H12DRAFT_594335 [Mycena haematopus]
MTVCPPTPVVKRRAERRASHPYMRFNTDFRTSLREETEEYPTENSSAVTSIPKYPSFRRAVSIEIPNSPGTPKTSNFAGYMRSTALEMTFPLHPNLSSPLAPKARLHTRTLPSHSLERIEESLSARICSRDEENHVLSSPSTSVLSANSPRLVSPSTVQVWTSSYRMASIVEEDELEGDGCPPISSSPDRSSDSIFPSRYSLSSPRTSDHDPDSPSSPILQSDVPREKAAESVVSSDTEFVSKLQTLLAVAAKQRERHTQIDNALAATDRSLSVTPDYRASPTLGYGKDVFGPRTARRTYSSSSADSSTIESCDCSNCARSRSASPTQSIASTSTYAGYAADLEGSPAFTPQAHSFSHAPTNFRASNSASPAQQRLIAISSHSVAPLKRSYSSLHDDYTTPPNRHTKKASQSRVSSHPLPDPRPKHRRILSYRAYRLACASPSRCSRTHPRDRSRRLTMIISPPSQIRQPQRNPGAPFPLPPELSRSAFRSLPRHPSTSRACP